ncbi:hypothetical protein D3C75_628880 [compost metagenome]
MPGLRRNFFELTNHAATVVDFNFLITGLTVQNFFVVAFDSQLANVVRGRVVCQFAVFIQTLNVFIVDFGNVANNVGQRRAVWVETAFIAFHFNAGEVVLIHGKTRNLHFCEVSFDRNGGEAMGTRAFFLKVNNIFVG